MTNNMRIITFEINKPGIKELIVPVEKMGERVEVWGLVEATTPGEYKVKVVMDHMAQNTYGRVVIKGVSMNGARVSIDGMVIIEEGAEKTDSFLEMRMLLLDKKSSAIVEPKLEIKNNNVKASHAATVGKIDEEELFYLKSRGVSEIEAKKLVVEGFLKEIKEKIKENNNLEINR